MIYIQGFNKIMMLKHYGHLGSNQQTEVSSFVAGEFSGVVSESVWNEREL